MRDTTMVYEESWALLVAVNNRNLAMLIYLWQDIGKPSDHLSHELSQLLRPRASDKSVTSARDVHGATEHPIWLWNSSHLFCLVEALCKQKFSEGLKFVLSCSATFQIYNSMVFEIKLRFLNQFLIRMKNRLDLEIQEILQLKLTQDPFATLALFTMIQIDRQTLKEFYLGAQSKAANATGQSPSLTQTQKSEQQ